jgi:hypothetical protein
MPPSMIQALVEIRSATPRRTGQPVELAPRYDAERAGGRSFGQLRAPGS